VPGVGSRAEHFGFRRDGNSVIGEAFIPSFGPRGSYLLGIATKLFDSSGNLIGFIESIRDMTDRRLLEQNLERTRTELHIAADIQRSFIPEYTPDVPGFDIAALTIPAMEVGGDFYDFIRLPDKRYGVVIADVAGKSVPAALFMAISRTILRANASYQNSISSVLESANKMVELDATGGMFVTLLFGVMDDNNLSFNYSNAGHPPPLVFRSANRAIEEEKALGIALGVNPDANYHEKVIALSPGDIIVLYTDGITEAMNNRGEFFGKERLIEIIDELREENAQVIVDGVLEDIKGFIGDIDQNDDLTLVILKAVLQR
jgi:sigma-B regulation protein RsbU (phosphoserine phosphatase)